MKHILVQAPCWSIKLNSPLLQSPLVFEPYNQIALADLDAEFLHRYEISTGSSIVCDYVGSRLPYRPSEVICIAGTTENIYVLNKKWILEIWDSHSMKSIKRIFIIQRKIKEPWTKKYPKRSANFSPRILLIQGN